MNNDQERNNPPVCVFTGWLQPAVPLALGYGFCWNKQAASEHASLVKIIQDSATASGSRTGFRTWRPRGTSQRLPECCRKLQKNNLLNSIRRTHSRKCMAAEGVAAARP